jgi:putative DNA primase/helicase
MNLHPDHLADLQKSGLAAETIQMAGIYTVPPDEIGKKLGGGDAGITSLLAFPYAGCNGYERFKCWYQEGKTGPKYLQKSGTPNHLYLLPGVDLAGDSPLIISEGEKKILALHQAGFQAVGLPGIWGWCEKTQGYRRPKENKPIPDFHLLKWIRPVSIVFDSDAHGNPSVRLASFRLGRELAKRGAAVSILFLPPGTNGEKVGADDFLVVHGSAKLKEMMP